MGVKAVLVLDRSGDMPDLLALKLAETCAVGAVATVEDARREIREQIGTGKKYPNLPNRSSSALEAPVNQMGVLLESIVVNPETDVVGIGAEAIVGVPYGPFLEFGTSKMEPRPFFGPAGVVGEEAVEKHLETVASALAK